MVQVAKQLEGLLLVTCMSVESAGQKAENAREILELPVPKAYCGAFNHV